MSFILQSHVDDTQENCNTAMWLFEPYHPVFSNNIVLMFTAVKVSSLLLHSLRIPHTLDSPQRLLQCIFLNYLLTIRKYLHIHYLL
jgi:hypothetical protein